MSKDRINATLKRRTDEWVAAGRWTHVNGNPFSAVAGDVLVDIRVRGDDAAQERVLAKNVNWSTVAYYRVSELGPPSTMPLPFYEVNTPSGSMYRVLAGVPIAWTGGACPVYEDVIVEVKFADSKYANGGPIAAGKLRWEWKDNGGDIIEFKIAADQGVVVAGHRKAIKPGCAGCETAICDECGPSRLKGITIRDTNTIVNAFAQGGAADQMAAAAHSVGKALPFSAPDLLDAAAGHMRDRAATYDKPEGERSMSKTVQAFNAITGRNMEAATKIQSMLVALKAVFETRGDDPVAVEMIDGLLVYAKDMKPVLRESEGWLLMAVLKMVRSEQRGQPHRDSVEDLIAYAALFGEARVGGK